jgi:aerobic C4-dicarboxylate transport protein
LQTTKPRRPWYTVLYIQVLLAIAVGVLIGHYFPHAGVALKPLGDGFIALIKMMIAPVIFCTVVHGIGSMRDLKKVGRVGVKTLFYFEAVSTVALVMGLVVGKLLQPGKGFDIDPTTLDANAVASYVNRAKEEGFVSHLLGIIPETFIGAFTGGDLLQVLLVSILTGFAISRLGELGERINAVIDGMAKVFFGVIQIIVRAAPIGAFGAMAFTVGAFGVGSLVNLIELIATFYLTSILFVVIVLGAIARFAGFSIFRFVAYIKDELLIVLGTSSSETVLPHMIQKMERLGASKSVVGLVIPTGYSFNLDGTNIYMTLSTLFLAQATNTPLTMSQELGILAIAMITSKGALGCDRRGFRDARGDARDRARHPDPVARHSAWHRQVHERMPCPDESGWQWRCYCRHQPVGARARCRAAEQGHGASDRTRRGARRPAGLTFRAPVSARAKRFARRAIGRRASRCVGPDATVADRSQHQQTCGRIGHGC